MSLITLGLALDYKTEGGLAATDPITVSSRPFFWQQMERTRANFVTVNDLAPLKKAVVTLTDAQIKALPTTPITLVAAPAGTEIIAPIMVSLRMNPAGGAYTNINTGATPGQSQWELTTNSQDFGNSIIYNSTAESNTMLSDMLATTTPKIMVTTSPWYNNESGFYGLYGYPNLTSSFVGQALQIKAVNTTNGNYTGGNAANTCIVTVLYIVL